MNNISFLTKSCDYAIVITIHQGTHFPRNSKIQIKSELDLKLRPPLNELIFASTKVKTDIVDVDSRGKCAFDSLLVYYVSDKEFQRLRRVNSSIELSICQQNTTDKVLLHMSDIKNVLHNRSNNHIYQFALNEGHSRDVIGRKKELIIDFDFREMPHRTNDKPKQVIKKIPLAKPKSSLIDINIEKFNAAIKRLEPSLTLLPNHQRRVNIESPRASDHRQVNIEPPRVSDHRRVSIESPRASALKQQKADHSSLRCIKCRAIATRYTVCNACVYEVFASPESTKTKRKRAAEPSSSNTGNAHNLNRYFRAARDIPLQSKRYKSFTERMGIPPSIPVS